MPDNDDTAMRERVDALLAKARSDETFAFSLKDDPDTVLRAAGFTDETLETLTREIGSSEVEGFQRCSWTCDRYSCWVTACGNIPYSN
jgi:hypothetical protein